MTPNSTDYELEVALYISRNWYCPMLLYELKIATRLGEVIALAACWAETVVGIVTSISYLNMIDRRPRA